MATQENKERRYQLIAALLTLLITVGTLTLLWFSTLRFQWPPEDGTRTVAQQDSILFGGEYVQLGDLDFPTDDDEMAAPGNPDDADRPAEPAVQGDAPDDNGNEAEREKPKVTQEKPSPAKETKKEEPKPEKTGTAKKKDESKPEQKKKNDKATDNKKNDNSSNKNNNNNKAADNSRNAPNPAAGKFGNGSKGGTQGSKDGNSNTGAKTGVGSIGLWPQKFPQAAWTRVGHCDSARACQGRRQGAQRRDCGWHHQERVAAAGMSQQGACLAVQRSHQQNHRGRGHHRLPLPVMLTSNNVKTSL